ncbi:hypothetical protein TL16_g08618 [Triparma laevis f. inornata]|uniref:Protein kinase domain-containing protein n=1 Tax=Triparma laevis f. inornata TaxID=1714386 RepID=A0A9W7EKR5_9STRA|nr:hypothetical protein TL16_g08618 [Triparma laevis f. inornata]
MKTVSQPIKVHPASSSLLKILIITLISTTNSFLPTPIIKFPAHSSPTCLLSTPTKPSLLSGVPSLSLSDLNDSDRALLDAFRSRALNDDDNSSIDSMELLQDYGSDLPPLPSAYNSEYLAFIFDKRPLLAVKRTIQIFTQLNSVLLGLIGSFIKGDLDTPESQSQNAANLRTTLTKLGPFFIKAGQALSIRPDVLPPPAMIEMQRLCDKVPSYSSELAFSILKEELGKDVKEAYKSISEEPVAAASLGQVYKAETWEGEEVAVKIQRPGVLETVSLDLYLVRKFGQLLKTLNLNNGLDVVSLLDEFAFRFYDELDYLKEMENDVVSLLDEFAFRFYDELDYLKEMENGDRIYAQFQNVQNVKIPKNYPNLTSRRVHTAEWCNGEKLSQSKSDDVGALVNLGVIVYLQMLLENGFFHADPHPGNMLRGDKGELVILDFGLMTDVSENARLGMVEAIVHLLNRDYELIGDDFKNLEFISPETDTTPIVPALKKVFDAALSGGGAKSINFQEVSADLAEITFEYDFKLPPYFALIIRAIAVLEGIALVGNPEFAIIDEAFPWIAKKLLSGDDARIKESLRYLVYGKDGIFDADRLIDVLVAFEKYGSIKTGDGTAFKQDGVRGGRDMADKGGSVRGTKAVEFEGSKVALSEAVAPSDATGKEALRFFFSEDGDFFRTFMLDEIANSVDALSRDALFTIGKSFNLSPDTKSPIGGLLLPGVGLLRSFNPPLNQKDKNNVAEVQKLLSFLRGRGGNEGAGGGFGEILPGEAMLYCEERSDELMFIIARGIYSLLDFAFAISTPNTLSPPLPHAAVLGEFRNETRDFFVQVMLRLTEKRIARGLNYLTSRTPQSTTNY